MTVSRYGSIVQPLRVLFEVGTVGELTDGQLLERFATSRGEGAELAFEVLVERHGGMVLRVCRGVLGNSSEAEDAFQATFLVLVRRARGLWVKESLGPWLHQVAYRTSRCALRSAVRRRRLEDGWASRGADRAQSVDAETGQVLHEEIERLPERFRAPVVLCDLEGRSHEQAARRLGWPVGTVKSRQARGRVRLRERLVRRGIGPERTVVGVISGLGGREVLIPPALIHGTVDAALRLGMFRGVAGGAAVSLMQGVLRTMWITQWVKLGSAAVVMGGTVVGGIGLVGQTQSVVARAPKPRDGGGLVVQEVKRGPMVVNAVETGSLEFMLKHLVFCDEFDGQRLIVSLIADGSLVKRGDIVCQLDSTLLRGQMLDQQVKANSAEADFLNAKLARERFQIRRREILTAIENGQNPDFLEMLKRWKQNPRQLEAKAPGGVPALLDPERARDYEMWMERLARTNHATKKLLDALPSDFAAAKPDDWKTFRAALETFSRETHGLEKLGSDPLDKATAKQRVEEIEQKVAQALVEEDIRKAAWQRERDKESKLAQQIDACTIVAPGNGVVVYANDRARPGRPGQIGPGAMVRERQLIFRVMDDKTHLQVTVKVPEASAVKLTHGMLATIRVEPFPDRVMTGRVESVSPFPDSLDFSRPGVQLRTVTVNITNGLAGLKRDMAARVEFPLGKRDDVSSVPFAAVVRYDRADHVALELPDGGIEWRVVKLGEFGLGGVVEVTKGLEDGERVVLNPLSLMTEEEKTRKLGGAGKGKRPGAPQEK